MSSCVPNQLYAVQILLQPLYKNPEHTEIILLNNSLSYKSMIKWENKHKYLQDAGSHKLAHDLTWKLGYSVNIYYNM